MLIDIIGLFSEEELAETNERLKQKKISALDEVPKEDHSSKISPEMVVGNIKRATKN